MVNVPAADVPYVEQAASGTGLPYAVVASQINEESGFNANAISPTGAEGPYQFEPGTYAGTGVGGSPFNWASETKAYIVYMNQLLKEEGGNVELALEAYNAGPGDLSAGQSYAQTILSNAGYPDTLSDSGGNSSATGGTTTTSVATTEPFPGGAADPLNWPSLLWGSAANAAGSAASGVAGDIAQGATGAASSLGEAFLKALGISSVKDLFIRLGLILLGATLIIIGLVKFADVKVSGSSSKGGDDSESETAPDKTVIEVDTSGSRHSEGSSQSRKSSPRVMQRPGKRNMGRFETGAGSATKGLGSEAAEGAELLA
jgi:hypothetical protein